MNCDPLIPDVEQLDEEWREDLTNTDVGPVFTGYYDGDSPQVCPPSSAFAGDGEDRYDEEAFP